MSYALPAWLPIPRAVVGRLLRWALWVLLVLGQGAADEAAPAPPPAHAAVTASCADGCCQDGCAPSERGCACCAAIPGFPPAGVRLAPGQGAVLRAPRAARAPPGVAPEPALRPPIS